MSVIATLGLLLIKIIRSKGYDVIIYVYDVTKSSYIVYVVMWPKFGNSSISMTDITITSVL